MRKLSLALIGLTFASITGADANPLAAKVDPVLATVVGIANYTTCTADFFADTKSFNSPVELGSITLPGLVVGLTPHSDLLSFDLSTPYKYVVRAAPTGTLNYYPASAECFHNPSVAYLACVNSRNGKCVEIKLECFTSCPSCTPPPALLR